MTAQQLFDAALAKVESASIRAWATSDRNRPVWLQAAQRAVDNGKTDPNLFTVLIVSTAIGL